MAATAPSGGVYKDTAAYGTGLPEPGVRVGAGARGASPLALILAGLLTVLTAAWAGIVPFVGPVFGFSGDGSGSWQWSLSHALLAAVPAAVAVGAGLVLIASAPFTARARGRIVLILLGLLIVACGGWLVMGFAAWPVLEGARYFVLASPLLALAHLAGYALGPGALLVACGGFVTGRAIRHFAGPMALSARPAETPAGVSPLGPLPARHEERPAGADPPGYEVPPGQPPEGGVAPR